MQTESSSLQDYLALLRRRRANLFVTFAVVAIGTAIGTLFIEDQYQSTATIAIERPEIPDDMVRTTVVQYDTDLRIDRNKDKVLSAENIATWIEEFDLYSNREFRSEAAAAARFRKDVEVITIQAREDIAVKNQGETIAFDVSYYGETPAKSLAVAERLAGQFLYENRDSRYQSVEATLAFFQRDADRLEKRIAEAEAALANFKQENAGALPDSAMVNTQMLDRTERELDEVEREIRDLREARKILETDLAKISPRAPIFSETGEAILAGEDRLRLLQQQFIELSSKYGPEHPDVITMRREIELLSGGNTSAAELTALRQDLEMARREYAAAQQRYTADHPDVLNLRNKVRILETQLANASSSPRSTSQVDPDNPEYISVLVQIEAADTELSALGRRASDLRSRIRRYEGLLLQAPQVEREYLALEREYNQAVAEFDEVRANMNDAQQARELEASEKGERYVLQRSPFEPTSAAFPNRLAIIILGIIFAVGCGFGSVVITEALDSTVRSVRDLRGLTGMPPIVVIPELRTQAERRSGAMIWLGSMVGVAGILIYLISMQIA